VEEEEGRGEKEYIAAPARRERELDDEGILR
jgi:hypothetical protein